MFCPNILPFYGAVTFLWHWALCVFWGVRPTTDTRRLWHQPVASLWTNPAFYRPRNQPWLATLPIQYKLPFEDSSRIEFFKLRCSSHQLPTEVDKRHLSSGVVSVTAALRQTPQLALIFSRNSSFATSWRWRSASPPQSSSRHLWMEERNIFPIFR